MKLVNFDLVEIPEREDNEEFFGTLLKATESIRSVGGRNLRSLWH